MNEEIDRIFVESIMKRCSSSDCTEEHISLLESLFRASREGHLALCLTDKELALLDTMPKGIVAKEPKEEVPSAWVCQWGNYLYLQKDWVHESKILQRLQELDRPRSSRIVDLDPLLNQEQRKAVKMGVTRSLFLLTGGPGTGKTFTAAILIKTILQSLENGKVIVTAPTGKAVAQLEKNLKKEMRELKYRFGTLHAILGLKSSQEESKIETLRADLIIVDECSMMDAQLFFTLLSSIGPNTQLILIGDKEQLPPVESGSVFADLIDSNVFATAHLKECLRSERADLLDFARAIREGNREEVLSHISHLPSHHDLWEDYRDKFFSSFSHPPSPQELFNSLNAFTILSCMRQGPLGIESINQLFFYQYLKQAPFNHFLAIPIMITRNDYELELFNGDLGCLIIKVRGQSSYKQLHIDDYALFYGAQGEIRKISALALGGFELAYALSVHKSQGSEYDEVLVLVPEGSEAFGRQVLYTAVTRAKRKIALASTPSLISECMRTDSRKRSGICARLSILGSSALCPCVQT